MLIPEVKLVKHPKQYRWYNGDTILFIANHNELSKNQRNRITKALEMCLKKGIELEEGDYAARSYGFVKPIE